MAKDDMKVITVGETDFEELTDIQWDCLCKAILDAYYKSPKEDSKEEK